MKNILTTSCLIVTTALLTSCSMKMTMDSTSNKQIKETTLANKTTARIGYTPVKAEWQCREIEKKYENIGANKMGGILKFGGADQVLQEHAVQYANQQKLKTNYIYLYTPTEYAMGGFNTSAVDNATITYYACKNPPALSNRIW